MLGFRGAKLQLTPDVIQGSRSAAARPLVDYASYIQPSYLAALRRVLDCRNGANMLLRSRWYVRILASALDAQPSSREATHKASMLATISCACLMFSASNSYRFRLPSRHT